MVNRGRLIRSCSLLAGLLMSFSLQAAPTSGLLLDISRAGDRIVTVGDRGHILYSDDEGTNWNLTSTPTTQLLTAVFFVDALNGWAVGHDAVILRTQDGGQTWVQQYQDLELEAPLLDIWFADANTGFALGAYGTLLRTDNGGTDWEDVSWLLENEDGFHLNAITEVANSGLFIVGEMGAMFRSADGGESWETVASPYDGTLFGVQGLTEDHALVAFGLRGHLFVSYDFGDSWTPVELDELAAGLASATVLDDGALVIVGHAGSVLRSTDGGRSFSVFNRSDRLSLSALVPTKQGNLILVGQHGLHHANSIGASVEQ